MRAEVSDYKAKNLPISHILAVISYSLLEHSVAFDPIAKIGKYLAVKKGPEGSGPKNTPLTTALAPPVNVTRSWT